MSKNFSKSFQAQEISFDIVALELSINMLLIEPRQLTMFFDVEQLC